MPILMRVSVFVSISFSKQMNKTRQVWKESNNCFVSPAETKRNTKQTFNLVVKKKTKKKKNIQKYLR